MKQLDYISAAQNAHSKFIKSGAFLTVKAKDNLNTMTIAWWTVGWMWHRPVLMVAVRPTRHTFSIIEKAADFTVSIPIPDLPEALTICGSKSGRDIDKFQACNLTIKPAQKTISPIIDIKGIHYECKIVLRAPIDASLLNTDLDKLYPAKDWHTMYYGEILNCYEL